jgi:hypothetical protein
MNYRHCESSHPFPVALADRESIADDLMVLVESGWRAVRTKQQISKAFVLGEQIFV